MARKRRRNSRSVYLLCAAVLGALCLLYWVPAPKRLAHGEPDLDPPANYGDRASVRPAALRVRPRPVYPYSVIRGGAYSVAELDAALRADPVAAAHYAVFHRAQMRLTAAPESTAVYVSYRQGDRIYWTRRKVHVAAEEALLTDGNHAARARCGNRISLTPQSPIGDTEPSAVDLDLPEPPSPADRDATADVLADVPLLVHEIFPTLLATWQPGGVPGGTAGSSPYGVYGAGSPGGAPFPAGQVWGSTIPPAAPGIWPAEFYPLPLPPVGPGVVWSPPNAQPGGLGPGSAAGSPPRTTGTAPPAVGSQLPGSGRGSGPAGGPSTNPSPNPIPGSGPRPSPGGPPLPPTSSGSPLPPTEEGPLPPPDVPPPNAPPPSSIEIPEPATAALLLCGALVAFRLLSRRRLG
jgi:hypothetical protein